MNDVGRDVDFDDDDDDSDGDEAAAPDEERDDGTVDDRGAVGDDEGDDDGEDDDVVGAVGSDSGGDAEVVYECSAWAGESRGLLASLLTSKGIRHAWQGTSLSVQESDEAEVDDLIDEILGSTRPALDPAADKVVYEVGTWSAAFMTTLGERLTAADIAYEYDEQGDLVVYATDEEAVEDILDDFPDATEGEIDETDGIELHEVLDKLFLATGKLTKNAEDAGAVVAVDEATVAIEEMSLPFGFDRPQWHALVGRAQALRSAIEADPDGDESIDDDQFRALAAEVRDLVRQYI